ncbi:Uncharacterised protein [Mycobacteroides abscessus subsp. abscessus]|nr:Uncharacterised protein [Mycobacteroides abscessus subsp. abscessus]
MADTQYPFNNDGLDQWGAEETIEVDKDRLIAYAEATNDPIEEHRKGQVAAPVFAIVPIFQSLVGTTMSVVPYQLIPRVVHGEQFFKFHRPIKPGDTLVAKSKMTGYEGMAARCMPKRGMLLAIWSTSSTSRSSSASTTWVRRAANWARLSCWTRRSRSTRPPRR